jgi:hypothetical protein
MAYGVARPAPSAARTTSGNSGLVAVDNGDQLAVLLNVTAVSGTTPSMTVSVQWSHDGTTVVDAETPDSMTAVTATGGKVKTFQVKGLYYRVAWAITGTTPSFTFEITTFTTT